MTSLFKLLDFPLNALLYPFYWLVCSVDALQNHGAFNKASKIKMPLSYTRKYFLEAHQKKFIAVKVLIYGIAGLYAYLNYGHLLAA